MRADVLPVLDNVRDDEDFGLSRQRKLPKDMTFKRTKSRRKPDLVGRRQMILVADQYYASVYEGSAKRLECGVSHWCC